MALSEGGGTRQGIGVYLAMNHFAPFTVSPSSETPFLRGSFDLRVDQFTHNFSAKMTGVEFLLRPDNSRRLMIAFGVGGVTDGDPEADLALFADTSGTEVRPEPTDSNSVGLVSGSGWKPGFDFGAWYLSSWGLEQDTNDEFYRVTFLYNSITGVITGRVTRLSTGESAPLPPGLSFNPGTTFSSDDPNDQFIISCGLNSTLAYVDNLLFEALSLGTLTEPPVLAAPAEGTHPPLPVPVSLFLPENALPGSVKLSFGETTLTLAAAAESTGAHSFSFDPANPTTSPYVASGSPVHDGVYAVTLSYQDDTGNPVASATNQNVTIERGFTESPVLAEPAGGMPAPSHVLVSFFLPEKALPGSVKLSFGETSLTLAATVESAGAHSFSFDPANPTASPFVVSGSPIPDGVQSVTLLYQDSIGNPAAGATNERVTIHSRFTLPPLLTRPVEQAHEFSPVLVSFSLPEKALAGSVKLSFGGTLLTLAGSMESIGSHSFSFDPADPAASPQVASATGPLAEGTYLVTLSYQDAVGSPAASDTSSGVTIDAGTSSPIWDKPAIILNNPGTRGYYANFGISVAVDGTRVVVGARKDGTDSDSPGSAYVYELSNGTTVPAVTLNNPNSAPRDSFGSSVAISGRWVVVAAPGSGSGTAYVYDLRSDTPSEPVATLNNPSPESGYQFATSVAISGTLVVIGAPYSDDNGVSRAGITYVYDLSSGTPTPTVPLATLRNPSPVEYDYFGLSVAISGTRVVVATRLGSAYVYDLNSGTPTVPAATLNNLGQWIKVAISDLRVVVGAGQDNTGAKFAGSAYVFDLNSGTPTVPVATLRNPTPGEFDYFGSAVAISGTRVVVGASGDDPGVHSYNAGSAYVYGLNGATQVTLKYPGGLGGWNQFGSSVAISGSIAAISALDDGSVYIYGPDSIVTQPPVLIAPEDWGRKSSPVQVSFSLPENALPGSVKLSFGGTILTLAATQEGAGSHSFSFDPANPTASPQIANATGPIADGSYLVTLSYQDANGNPAASDSSIGVTIDRGTLPPVLLAPAANTTPDLPMQVSYTLTETPKAGTVKLTFGSYVLTLSALGETSSSGGVAFRFDPANPMASPYIASGSPIPDGVYAVTLSYQDTQGNLAASDASSHVTIHTVTLPPPVLLAPVANSTMVPPMPVNYRLPKMPKGGTVKLAFGPYVLTMSALGEAYDGYVAFSFDPANPTASPYVASGSPIPDGVYTVTLSYQASVDDAMAMASAMNGNVTISTVPGSVAPVVHTALYGEGDSVPESAGLPFGTVWRKFGVPAVNAAGKVVFTAEWANAEEERGAVFGISPATGELKIILERGVGAPAPGVGMEPLPADAVVAKLRDPIMAANGDVLTPVMLAGKGITSANDRALVWSPQSKPTEARLVVCEGQALAGGRVKAITAAQVGSAGVAFTAILTGRSVTSANDFVACVWTPLGGAVPVAREGQTFDGATLKRFQTLGTWAGAAGQGRGMAALESGPLTLGLLGKFSDGSTAVLALEPGGAPEIFTATGSTPFGTPFKTLGLPAWAGLLTSPVYLGTLENGTKGVFQYDAITDTSLPVGLVGTEIEPGILLKSAKDPVVSSDGTRKAWDGTIKGDTVKSANDRVIVFANGSDLSIVAREGTAAPEAPDGALWKSFKSLAMPARGPLLLGELQRGPGGVTGADDVGVWAMGSAGTLRCLFREEDTIGGKKLKSYTVLKAISGTPGVTRSWNDAGEVVWLATFTDGSSAIVKTQVP